MRMLIGIVAGLAMAFAGTAMGQVYYSQQPPPPPPPPQGGQPYYPTQPGYNQGYGYAYGNQTVSCGSQQYRFGRCQVPGYWRGARIVRQTSDSQCIEGRTWGFSEGSIWVDRGCGGVFAAGYYNGGWQPGPNWNQNFGMSCGSPQHRYNFCQVDVGARGQVVLQRQLSNSACIAGRTWGWNRAGIWVDRGCSGQFIVQRRW